MWEGLYASTVPASVMERRSRSIYRLSLRRLFVAKSTTPINRRILVIDDNPDIHGDFRKVIGGGPDDAGTLAAAELALLGESSPSSLNLGFEVDSAFQGREG